MCIKFMSLQNFATVGFAIDFYSSRVLTVPNFFFLIIFSFLFPFFVLLYFVVVFFKYIFQFQFFFNRYVQSKLMHMCERLTT